MRRHLPLRGAARRSRWLSPVTGLVTQWCARTSSSTAATSFAVLFTMTLTLKSCPETALTSRSGALPVASQLVTFAQQHCIMGRHTWVLGL